MIDQDSFQLACQIVGAVAFSAAIGVLLAAYLNKEKRIQAYSNWLNGIIEKLDS